MGIQDKTIVITGASKGLGRAMAIHFSQKQANVVLVARTEGILHQVQAEIKTLTGNAPLIITCDVSSEIDVQRMATIIQDKFRKIDVLINNAGFGTFRESADISNQEMHQHFAVNFFGAYYCIRALLPLLKQSESSYILNIGSLFSKVALAENSVYAATKFALTGFSEGLRRELKPMGIKVGLFLPGPIKTAFHKNRAKSTLESPQSLMLDPKKVAARLEIMIRRREKQSVFPRWMLPALRLKTLITDVRWANIE